MSKKILMLVGDYVETMKYGSVPSTFDGGYTVHAVCPGKKPVMWFALPYMI